MKRGFSRAFGAPVLGALVLLVSGCQSGEDFNRLHSHISDVEKKVEELAKQSSSKDEIGKLNDSLKQQSDKVLRSNADLGTKFNDLIREMQGLSGKLEDANRRLAQLSTQIADTQARLAAASVSGTVPLGSPAAPATTAPAAPAGGSRGPSPSDLYAQATADYQRGQFELARQGFEEFVETYPKTDLSDDATYWIGECYSAQKKHKDAISAYDKLVRTFPRSDKAAAAHFKKGLSHLELGEKAQAIVQLQFVVHEYPETDEAKSARNRLRALGSDAR